jgi:hypothetical protein
VRILAGYLDSREQITSSSPVTEIVSRGALPARTLFAGQLPRVSPATSPAARALCGSVPVAAHDDT